MVAPAPVPVSVMVHELMAISWGPRVGVGSVQDWPDGAVAVAPLTVKLMIHDELAVSLMCVLSTFVIMPLSPAIGNDPPGKPLLQVAVIVPLSNVHVPTNFEASSLLLLPQAATSSTIARVLDVVAYRMRRLLG